MARRHDVEGHSEAMPGPSSEDSASCTAAKEAACTNSSPPPVSSLARSNALRTNKIESLSENTRRFAGCAVPV